MPASMTSLNFRLDTDLASETWGLCEDFEIDDDGEMVIIGEPVGKAGYERIHVNRAAWSPPARLGDEQISYSESIGPVAVQWAEADEDWGEFPYVVIRQGFRIDVYEIIGGPLTVTKGVRARIDLATQQLEEAE